MNHTRQWSFLGIAVLALAAGVSAAGVVPTDIPGLEGWLKADAITGVSDGGAVSTWPGSGGSLVSARQTDALQRPTYHRYGINGHPVVRFNNDGDPQANPKEMHLMDSVDAATWQDLGNIGNNGQGMTLMVVLKSTAVNSPWWADGTGYLISDDNGTINASVGRSRHGAWRHALNTGLAAPGTPAFSIFAVTCADVDPSAANTITTFIDGGQKLQVTGANSGLTTSYNVLLCADSPDAPGRPHFGGDLAELVIYNRLLSSAEIGQISAYWVQKYGLDRVYPDDISGLEIWLKADAVTGVSDGGAVSQWPGSGGSLASADQTDPLQQPAYHTNVVNGLPAVRFSNDGNPQANPKEMHLMDSVDAATWQNLGNIGNNGQGMTLMAVLKSTAVNSPWWADGTGYLIGDDFGVLNASVGRSRHYAWRHALNTGMAPSGTPAFSIFAVTWTDVDPLAANTITTFIDGGQKLQVTGANSGLTTSYNVLLCADSPDAPGRPHFGGDLAELVIYNRLLSSAEIDQVGYYLERKYGLETPYGPYPRGTVMILR